MTQWGGFPFWAGGHHRADLHLAIADDDPINESCDQLSALGKRQMVQSRAAALAKSLEALGEGPSIHLRLRLGIKLAQVVGQAVLGLGHLLSLTLALAAADDRGQGDFEEPGVLAFELRQSLPDRPAPGV